VLARRALNRSVLRPLPWQGIEALEVLRHTPKVGFVFTDLRMPGSMDGAEFARFVRSAYPVLKIVLTSGESAAVDLAEHDGFFPIPYDRAKVIQHIEGLLE
jgi:CheY-like chemotaxis protein